MLKTKKIIILLLSSLLFLTGCLEKNILEELGIVTIYGFDLSDEDNMLQATTVLFQFNPDITDASQVIQSKGHTFREVRNNANKKSGYKIVSGQLRTILFGPKISEDGVFPYIDTLERDASISDMVFVAMSKDPTEQVLSATNYEQSPNIGTYIQRLIETAVRDERLISSTLHEFTHKFFAVGQDPLVPIIANLNNKAQLLGLAIFKDDRYVGELTLEDVFYVRLIADEFKSGQVEMELPTKQFEKYLKEYEDLDTETFFVVMDQLYNDVNIELKNPDSLSYKIDIDIKGRIVELSERIDLQKEEAIKLLEQEVSKEVKDKLTTLIDESKELQADYFGFGLEYTTRKRGEEITKDQWHDMYPNINVDINVTTKIRSYGIVE
ncbi:Ger(x)C family spore germination protein [Aquisalibacillus elongatus]|uniref:Spore germination protein n=1 Tax=Aquisalibacillus elongatus TaxID=485577 RepID=A0A3N5AYS1_9BACI|nr:Ger(x)C family spore germination protein [Aquisalibacillus elongatus]RPF50119.1 spore germination protein [Aquisalibacillus elongatus]